MTIVERFNDCINRQDLVGMQALMTPDHKFVDREGETVAGRVQVGTVWGHFFKLFPDYRNTFTRVEAIDGGAGAIGYAMWRRGGERDQVIWTAKIEDSLIAEWRIRPDTKENRRAVFGGSPTDS